MTRCKTCPFDELADGGLRTNHSDSNLQGLESAIMDNFGVFAHTSDANTTSSAEPRPRCMEEKASVSRCRLWILRQPKEGLCASATAAAVADKSNARVTISAALAEGVAGWDDSGNARLPPGSLLIGCGQDLFFSGFQLLGEDTAPFAVDSCCIFPALCVDVQGLHVALADIFEAPLGAANSSLERGKFAVDDVLRYTAILRRSSQAIPSCVV